MKLHGIWSPMPTAMKKDGLFADAKMRELVDYLIEAGIDGLFPLGTTGEFALLTSEERNRVLECVVDQTNGRVPVFAGVSDPSTENVIRFSADAKNIGADGVTATPPYFYSTTDDALFKHYEILSRRVDLPLMVYNIPKWTHEFVPPRVVQRLVEEQLIVAMKYTEYNLLNLLEFIRVAGDKIAIFTGSDAMAYTNLEFGGAGAIMAVSNLVPTVAAAIYDEFQKGNLKKARDAQFSVLPLLKAMTVGKFPLGLKATMRLMGRDVGQTKEPLPHITNEQQNQIRAYIEAYESSSIDGRRCGDAGPLPPLGPREKSQ